MKTLKNLGCPEYLMLVSIGVLLLIASSVLNKHKSENAAGTVKGNGNQFLSFSP